MKVLLINGSPHEHGCTDTALIEVAATLEKHGSKRKFCIWARNPSPAVGTAAVVLRRGGA